MIELRNLLYYDCKFAFKKNFFHLNHRRVNLQRF